METVWLGLGSNLGDREALIREAVARLGAFLSEGRVSRLWESKARYVIDQPDFLNAVYSGRTSKAPQELLLAIQDIERDLGRDRSAVQPKGARTIDIDILLYGRMIIVSDSLVVPHSGIRERMFVLLPLTELDPSLIDPLSGRLFTEYLAELPPQGIYPYGPGIYDSSHP